jgi:hypothetical protein
MPKYYLIWLQGQGDTHAKVVDEESWNWITEPKLNIPTPQSIIDRYVKAEGDREEIEGFKATSGSWKNDRALIVPGIYYKNHHLDSFSDATECMEDVSRWKKLLKIKGWEDSFEGYIY